MKRLLVYTSLLIALGGMPAYAGSTISVDAAWLQSDPEKVAYFRLHACEHPITAGGTQQDDPALAPVSCDGELYEIHTSTPEVYQLDIPVEKFAGVLYFRVGAVGDDDKKGKLSKQVEFKYNAKVTFRNKITLESN